MAHSLNVALDRISHAHRDRVDAADAASGDDVDT